MGGLVTILLSRWTHYILAAGIISVLLFGIRECHNKIDRLEMSNNTLQEQVNAKSQSIRSLDFALDGCLNAFDEYKEKEAKVRTVFKRVKVKCPGDVEGVPDEESSRDIGRAYNDILQ